MKSSAERTRRWRERHKVEGVACPWYAANRDAVIERVKEYAAQNPVRRRGYVLKYHLKKYGLTVEGYAALKAEQNNCCAICGVNERDAPTGRLSIDHCHTTGKVRGLLCKKCNTMIGMAEDQVWVLHSAVEYLK